MVVTGAIAGLDAISMGCVMFHERLVPWTQGQRPSVLLAPASSISLAPEIVVHAESNSPDRTSPSVPADDQDRPRGVSEPSRIGVRNRRVLGMPDAADGPDGKVVSHGREREPTAPLVVRT